MATIEVLKYMRRQWGAAGGVRGGSRGSNPTVEFRPPEVAARLGLPLSDVETALGELVERQAVHRLGPGSFALTPPGVILADTLPRGSD